MNKLSVRSEISSAVFHSVINEYMKVVGNIVYLLTLIYRLASAAIANRIKPILDILISCNQNRFVPGRYIRESTRFIYDIMNFTENHSTVEPRLSQPHGRHTIRPDNRGVRIDKGSLNSRSMGYRVGDN